jgi:hypothetical protein
VNTAKDRTEMRQAFCYFVVRSVQGGLAVQRVMRDDRDAFIRAFPEALISEHRRLEDACSTLLRLNRAGWQLASYERKQLHVGQH